MTEHAPTPEEMAQEAHDLIVTIWNEHFKGKRRAVVINTSAHLYVAALADCDEIETMLEYADHVAQMITNVLISKSEELDVSLTKKVKEHEAAKMMADEEIDTPEIDKRKLN